MATKKKTASGGKGDGRVSKGAARGKGKERVGSAPPKKKAAKKKAAKKGK